MWLFGITFKLYNRALHRVIKKKIITITNYSTNNSGVAMLNFIGGTLTGARFSGHVKIG